LQYPEDALKDKIEGKVYIRLIIDTTGMPICGIVIKGLSNECDQEALRLSQLYRFTPAISHNKKTRVAIVLTISFNIKEYLSLKEVHPKVNSKPSSDN